MGNVEVRKPFRRSASDWLEVRRGRDSRCGHEGESGDCGSRADVSTADQPPCLSNMLASLWRTDPMYHELKESHSSYESVHDWWRDRYKVAADDIGIRPKVRGIHWHRLRANVAGLVEWLRICSREGWLASDRRNHGEAKRGFQERGELIADRLAGMRVRMGVARAYGEKALELGLGDRAPPSRRARGRQPDQTTLDFDATT